MMWTSFLYFQSSLLRQKKMGGSPNPRVVTPSLLGPRRHICCLFEQECARPALATLGAQMAQNPVTGLKESYFPHCLPHLHTSSAAILVMVRGLWALALAPLLALLSNNWVEIRLDPQVPVRVLEASG